jgi:outer membrane protein assembly factor BamB
LRPSARLVLSVCVLATALSGALAAPQRGEPPETQGAVNRRFDNWPQWRGPLGNGVAPHSFAPVSFGPEDIAWKVEIPGQGLSSPVVWEDLVFVTTAVPVDDPEQNSERPRRRPRARLVEHEFRLIALHRVDGAVAWDRVATVATPHERYHRTLSSYANASPVTDGERVYAFFGSRGLHAFDLDGVHLWSRDFGVQMQIFTEFGEASSPALFGDSVVVLFDHEGQSFIEAVDAATGETRWKQLRDEVTSWTSPFIVDVEGRAVVVASGGNFVTAYDLETGEVLWRCPGMTPRPIPTPVAGDGLLIAASGSTERRVQAIDLGIGDAAAEGTVMWRLDKAAPYNPSPLLWDDELYLVRDGGLNAGTSRLSLIDARTGEPRYLQERLPGSYTIKASPVGAGDYVYLATEEGDIIVIRRGDPLEVVAVNALGEPFIATPAIAHGDLIVRSREHLMAIRDRSQ